MKARDFEELGFATLGGSGYRRVMNPFYVIDALPGFLPAQPWRLEIRAGSDAYRIGGRVETREELETLLRILERGD